MRRRRLLSLHVFLVYLLRFSHCRPLSHHSHALLASLFLVSSSHPFAVPHSNTWSFNDIRGFRIDLGRTRDRVVVWLLLKGSIVPPRTRTKLEIRVGSERDAQALASRLGFS